MKGWRTFATCKRSVRAAAAAALVTALLLTGCGGKKPGRAASGAAPSTTTGPGGSATFALTGLVAGDPARRDRPALSVKIDNLAAARPQGGLNDADMVVEQPVEGGLTRLFATFQSKDAATVGPVRSARPVDALLLRQLGPSLFAFAGASAGVLQVVQRDSGATLLDPSKAPGAFHRVSGRQAPHNTFSSTAALYAAGRQANAKLGPPRRFLPFAGAPPGSARPAKTARLTFSPSSRSAWQWDGRAGHYLRFQDGTLDRLQGGATVSADNVVVLSVAVRASSNVDVLGNRTPDPVLVGSGRAWVLRDGRMVAGTWRRSSAGAPMELLAGSVRVPLHPGRTWVELLPTPQQPSFPS